jgi:hypothetical protein
LTRLTLLLVLLLLPLRLRFLEFVELGLGLCEEGVKRLLAGWNTEKSTHTTPNRLDLVTTVLPTLTEKEPVAASPSANLSNFSSNCSPTPPCGGGVSCCPPLPPPGRYVTSS